MSSYPIDPRFERWIHPADASHDPVVVYVTSNNDILIAAPYMDLPAFGADMSDAICDAIRAAAALTLTPGP